MLMLDGSDYDQQWLIDKARGDEFYYGALNKLALSSSSCKMLLDSPKTFHNVMKYGSNDSSPALLMGRVIHVMVLEPENFDKIFEVVDVASKNTKAFKEAQLDNPKTCITRKDLQAGERMADAFNRNEAALSYLADAECEVPMVDLVGGFPFRGKADIYRQGEVIDLKTTTDLKAFKYSADKYGYDLQAYIYCNLFKTSYKDFTFIALDKGSCDVGIYDISEEFYKRGEAKFNRAISMYRDFFVRGEDLDTYTIRGTL
jgi:exodeoxyribonuclease VIII